MEQILADLTGVSFYQIATISIGLFFADFIVGVAASLRAGRRIKSSVMHQGLSKKMMSYCYHLVVGLAFHFASMEGEEAVAGILGSIGAAIVFLPAIPELLSIYENWKEIRRG